MSDSTLRIEYALAKQVPEIARVARFDTAYGELRLTGGDAKKVAALVSKLLRVKLTTARAYEKRTASPTANTTRAPGQS
jgi:hypothetical protein